MGPTSEVTGGTFQDLASFAIFFDLREAHFEHFSPDAVSLRIATTVPMVLKKQLQVATLACWRMHLLQSR